MWYFTWILGVSLAVSLAVLNGMLCEARECALNNTDKEN
jgi:cyd operon protein YbgT